MNRQQPVCYTQELRSTKPQRSARQRRRLRNHLPEVLELERLIRRAGSGIKVRVEHQVEVSGDKLPIYSLCLGRDVPDNPALLLVGGMHGIERIGTQILLGYLTSLIERLTWDSVIADALQKLHLVFVPILNPGGMYYNKRGNLNNVDLNRNAPIDAQGRVPWPGGGQRLTPWLPWYRGDEELEDENRVLERVAMRELIGRPLSVSLDMHSGFGFRDRIWFPYAYRHRPIRSIARFMAMKLLWERTYPHNRYLFEPQAQHYVCHGDMWDYLYKKIQHQHRQEFLPLTLELGSWNWVRKRPQQLFSRLGLFHPVVPHRLERTLRDHHVWLDFLISSTVSYRRWMPSDAEAVGLRQSAISLWYRDRRP